MSEAAKEAAWWPFGAPREGASVRLFCLPYAGGGATVFRGWRLSAPREIDVVPIQLPGREARIRHAPFQRLGPLVEALDAILRPTLAPAYALFGHSMGALIAFELARRCSPSPSSWS